MNRSQKRSVSTNSAKAEARLLDHLKRSDFQVRRPDVLAFCSLQGLTREAGVPTRLLRHLLLKELTDNALDEADAAGRHGAVTIRQLAPDKYEVCDEGRGIAGSATDLAALFAIDRPMISKKFWRRPERGALGNGLRVVVGALVATEGTIEIETRGQWVTLRPERSRTEIIETGQSARDVGTRIVVAFGPGLPHDARALRYCLATIALAQRAGPPHRRRPSPHWYDVDQFAENLSIIEPVDVTLRQLLEQLDGCSGAAAGRIAAPFGKNRHCRDLKRAEVAKLLTTAQSAARKTRGTSLGALGRDTFEAGGYVQSAAGFDYGRNEPKAEIPFLVECWARVDDRNGNSVELSLYVNRTTIVGEVTARRVHAGKALFVTGCGLSISVKVPGGSCQLILHLTSPMVPIVSNGKQPDLAAFEIQIGEAIRRAYVQARNRLSPYSPVPKSQPAERTLLASPPPPKVFVPSGCLGKRIVTEAAVAGVSVDDLTVLSPGRDPYRCDHAMGHRDGEWFAEQVCRFVSPNSVVHLRGLFYRLVAAGDVRRPGDGGPFINTEGNWRWLCEKAAKAARWLGLVPFERIRDERAEAPSFYGGVDEESHADRTIGRRLSIGVRTEAAEVSALHEMLPALIRSKTACARQPFRICIIGEKSSLGEVLRPIAKEVGGELLLSSGDPSETHIAEIAARANADGRPLVVLYVADFDPGGWHMPTAVARKLQAHRDLRFANLDVQLHRVALTLEQVLEYDLPSTPLKATEARAGKWRATMGREQTEIDALAALRPEIMERIIREAIRPFYDPTLIGRYADATAIPDEARAWLEGRPEYRAAVKAITAAHKEAEEAIDELNDIAAEESNSLRQAVENAEDAPRHPIIDIKPEFAAIPPKPLFTTADGFPEASRRLKAGKLLDADEYSEEPGER